MVEDSWCPVRTKFRPCLIFLGQSAAVLGFVQFLLVTALGRRLPHVIDEGLIKESTRVMPHHHDVKDHLQLEEKDRTAYSKIETFEEIILAEKHGIVVYRVNLDR